MTPNICILHVRAHGSKGFRLWLPLFLLWIPGLLLAPLFLLGWLVYSLACRVPFFGGVAILWRLLCALPGTDVLVDAEGTHVLVRIY